MKPICATLAACGLGFAMASTGVAQNADVPTRVDSRGNEVYQATDVIGMPVQDQESQKVGKIEDLVIDAQTGEVLYTVVSFSGVEEIGDKWVVLPWTVVEPRQEFVMLTVPTRTIVEAPAFTAAEFRRVEYTEWAPRVNRFFADVDVDVRRSARRDRDDRRFDGRDRDARRGVGLDRRDRDRRIDGATRDPDARPETRRRDDGEGRGLRNRDGDAPRNRLQRPTLPRPESDRDRDPGAQPERPNRPAVPGPSGVTEPRDSSTPRSNPSTSPRSGIGRGTDSGTRGGTGTGSGSGTSGGTSGSGTGGTGGAGGTSGAGGAGGGSPGGA